MDENCLVSIKLPSQHYTIENSSDIQEKPAVMGKPMGIVRKTTYITIELNIVLLEEPN